jgi:Zn-dependent metalloprotease
MPNPVVSMRNYTIRDGNNSDTAVSASAYTTVTLQGLSAASSGLYYPKGQYVNCINLENPKSDPPGVSSLTAFIYTRSNTNFEWIMVYYHIDELQRYIQSLGFTNINNRSIKVDAHGLNGQDNSHYVVSPAGAGYICFGDGGVDDAEDAEIITHEYGHAIQDNQKPGYGTTNEAGAIGEGFGDILAAVYYTAFSGGFQDNYIGDWDATSYSTDTPPFLRRVDGTKHYPTDLQNDVHADGEMWSATIWSIYQTLGHNSTARDIVIKLLLQSQFTYTVNESFKDGADDLMQADTLLYGGIHTGIIQTAFYNLGVYSSPTPVELSGFNAE